MTPRFVGREMTRAARALRAYGPRPALPVLVSGPSGWRMKGEAGRQSTSTEASSY